MNLGFVVPLAADAEQCYDAITPNDMQTSSVCAASGTFIIIGGWAGVMWVFLRSLSLHLQICWQVVVGRNFMWFSQVAGWGIPAIGIVLALTLSGVSFRFGGTCHINHQNSLADLWIPLLALAGLTIIIQFATFGYCIKVYLASLSDNSATTEGSGLPSYSNSIRTMTPRQAYRRVRRVIQLQWRGIAIVIIIITDVVFFAIVFVFQDNTVQNVKVNPNIAQPWITCLLAAGGNKNDCLGLASALVVNMPTVGAVLVLLGVSAIASSTPVTPIHFFRRLINSPFPPFSPRCIDVCVGPQQLTIGRTDERILAAHPPGAVDDGDGVGRDPDAVVGRGAHQARVCERRRAARRSQK